jgi:adenylate cyclase
MDESSKKPVRITVVLTIAISGLVALAVGSVLFVNAYSNYQNTLQLFAKTAKLVVSSVEQGVRGHLEPANDLLLHLQHLAHDGSLDHNSPDELIATLRGSLAAPHQIYGVEFWTTEFQEIEIYHDDHEVVVERSDASNDFELKTLLRNLRGVDQIYWDSPFYEQGETYLTAYTLLHHDDHEIGAAATGVSVTALTELVTTLGTRHGMTAFIAYDEEHLLAHPDLNEANVRAYVSSKDALVHIDKLASPLLRELLAGPAAVAPEKDGFTIRRVERDDGAYFLFSKTLRGFSHLPWTIGVYSRADQINEQIMRMFIAVIIGGLLLLVSIVAAIILARRLATPIRRVSAAASQIGKLELDAVSALPRSRIKELDDQALAFNRMLDALYWFRTYVPSRLVQSLVSGDGQALTSSTRENLTVMFTDIVGFTALSETMKPEEIANLLNEHFEIINEGIEETGGTLDKYIGDAVMAFWGAPERFGDHAVRACRAALLINQRLEESSGLRIKIGIHTGPLVVGNIGAKARMNYTVIGDTVNLCARIESLCSDLDDGKGGAMVLISDATKQALGEEFKTVKKGEFSVKNCLEPVTVWRLLPS